MKLYKLTNQKGQTQNETQWGEDVEHTVSGEGELCSEGWLHAYTSPLLAMMLNPAHADIKNPRLWEAEGDVGRQERGLKVGCTRLKTIREIPLPEVSDEQRVRFAILCALEVYKDETFVKWAKDWLSKKDRTVKAAWAARAAAWAVQEDEVMREAAWAAAWSAWAASLGSAPAAVAQTAMAVALTALAASRVVSLDLHAIAVKGVE